MIEKNTIVVRKAMAAVLAKDLQRDLFRIQTTMEPIYSANVMARIQRCFQKSCELQASLTALGEILISSEPPK